MESLIGWFEATGSVGRSHTVLVYVTLAAAGGGVEVVAGERLATSDGLTVVRLAGDLYFTALTGVRLTRRPGHCSAEGPMRHLMSARARGSDGREYDLRAFEAGPREGAAPAANRGRACWRPPAAEPSASAPAVSSRSMPPASP